MRDSILQELTSLDRVVQLPDTPSGYGKSGVTPELFGVVETSSAFDFLNELLRQIGQDASTALAGLVALPPVDLDLLERLMGLTALGESTAALPPDLLAHLSDAWGLANSLDTSIRIWDDRGWPPPELALGTPEGDFLLIRRTDGDPDERLAAMKRVAQRTRRLRYLRYRPAIRRVLARRAEALEMPVDEVLATEVAAAMVLVSGWDTHPQTVRLGGEWVKDARGKKAVFPPEQLDVWSYRDWFENAVERSTRRSLLDWPDVLPVGQDRPIEELEDKVVPIPEGLGGDEIDLEDPQADNPLDLLVELSDHSERCRRLAAVLDLATPKQRQILRLLAGGLTKPQIARELGIAPATVRAQLSFLRERSRAAGLVA